MERVSQKGASSATHSLGTGRDTNFPNHIFYKERKKYGVTFDSTLLADIENIGYREKLARDIFLLFSVSRRGDICVIRIKQGEE